MTAAWVHDDHDVVKWVDATIASAGAYWTSGPSWELFPATVAARETTVVRLKNDDYVTFYEDNSRLKIEFTAHSGPAGWEYTEYSYQYEQSNNTMIFRFDKHHGPTFEQQHGTDCHVHVGAHHDRDKKPTRPVDLSDVIAEVRSYQTTGSYSYF
jgi:hypothetical protein